MRRLKLPQLSKTLQGPLSEEEILRVLAACLNTHERLRNFAILMIFLDTGIRLDDFIKMLVLFRLQQLFFLDQKRNH